MSAQQPPPLQPNISEDDFTQAESEVDIRRLEARTEYYKFADSRLRERHSWKRAILVPVMIASAAAIVGALSTIYSTYLQGQQALEIADREDRREDLRHEHTRSDVEHREILKAARLPEPERVAQLCVYNSLPIGSSQNRKILGTLLDDGRRCVRESTSTGPNDRRLSECRRAAVSIVGSCHARDKSGFHSRPRAECQILLEPPADKVFLETTVEVLRQSYRRDDGQDASSLVKPEEDKEGGVSKFTGTIFCTNDRGTGRTCEAFAEVRATAVPRDCVDLLRSTVAGERGEAGLDEGI